MTLSRLVKAARVVVMRIPGRGGRGVDGGASLVLLSIMLRGGGGSERVCSLDLSLYRRTMLSKKSV